jgi:hypothetical protein
VVNIKLMLLEEELMQGTTKRCLEGTMKARKDGFIGWWKTWYNDRGNTLGPINQAVPELTEEQWCWTIVEAKER